MHRFSTGVLVMTLLANSGCQPGAGLDPSSVAPSANPTVTQENFEMLQERMTQDKVEAILGSGSVASATVIDRIHPGFGEISAQHNFRLKEAAAQGRCYVWSNAPMYIIVVYNSPPGGGGAMTYGTLIRYTEGPGGLSECENLSHKGLL